MPASDSDEPKTTGFVFKLLIFEALECCIRHLTFYFNCWTTLSRACCSTSIKHTVDQPELPPSHLSSASSDTLS